MKNRLLVYDNVSSRGAPAYEVWQATYAEDASRKKRRRSKILQELATVTKAAERIASETKNEEIETPTKIFKSKEELLLDETTRQTRWLRRSLRELNKKSSRKTNSTKRKNTESYQKVIKQLNIRK